MAEIEAGIREERIARNRLGIREVFSFFFINGADNRLWPLTLLKYLV